MLPKPRVAAIDDEQAALNAIADALNDGGAACLKLLYNGGVPEGTTLEQIRVLFVDLHLSHPSGENETQHFSTIGGILLDHIAANNGPFILIVWTLYPDRVVGLANFLCERLIETPHAIPTQIKTLSKIDHIRENAVVDGPKLVAAVKALVTSEPQIAALVNWENRVNAAASETIAALLELVPNDKRDTISLVLELGRLLNALATEAVGSSNVSKDRFAAVNEALLPILYDRVSRLKIDKADERLWNKAIPSPGQKAITSSHEAAKLNSMLHVDFDTKTVSRMDRGVVLEYPAELIKDDRFREAFGMTPERFLKDQLCLTPLPGNADVRWLLIQVEGVCDHAQAQPGPAPYLLGVESSVSASKTPQAVWESPVLFIDSSEKKVYASFRFGHSFTNMTVKDFKVLFRLREALSNDLVSRMHSYGARPGIITFRNAPSKISNDPIPESIIKEPLPSAATGSPVTSPSASLKLPVEAASEGRNVPAEDIQPVISDHSVPATPEAIESQDTDPVR